MASKRFGRIIAAQQPGLQHYWGWVLVIGVIVAFVVEGVRIVRQQSAWVIERLGRFEGTLEPGLNLIIPFFDKVAYVHSLKEVPLDVPEQVCITKDNTQLGVDGILYYQVTDPRLASYGSSNYVSAISQLAQTTLRSEIGKMELDKTFESREDINRQIVHSLDEAGRSRLATDRSRRAQSRTARSIGSSSLEKVSMPARRTLSLASPPSCSTRSRVSSVLRCSQVSSISFRKAALLAKCQ